MQAAMILLLFRHMHFFVIANEPPRPPVMHLETRQFFTYTDPLRLSVYDDRGQRQLQTVLPIGQKLDPQIPAPGWPLYLVEADPGMNGATFDCIQPWAVLASANHPLGSNGPGPTMYFFVPSDCQSFVLGASSVSPNEGARITIMGPGGEQRAVLDGEFNAEEKATVPVSLAERGCVWSLAWSKSQTTPALLDDLNLWLDGKLTPLLFPQQQWAEQHGQPLHERDRAAREQ